MRDLSRQSVLRLIHGPGESVLGVLDALSLRQEMWHADPRVQEQCRLAYPFYKRPPFADASDTCLTRIDKIRKQVLVVVDSPI